MSGDVFLDQFPKRPRQYAADILSVIFPDLAAKPEESDFLLQLSLCLEASVPKPIQEFVLDHCLNAYMRADGLVLARELKAQKKKSQYFERRPARKVELDERSQRGRCKYCRQEIFWHPTRRGKRMPVDPDGSVHFETCSYQQGEVKAR